MRARLRSLVWPVGVKKGSGICSRPSVLFTVMQILVAQNRGTSLFLIHAPCLPQAGGGSAPISLIQRCRLVELLPLGASSNTMSGGKGTVELDTSDFQVLTLLLEARGLPGTQLLLREYQFPPYPVSPTLIFCMSKLDFQS